MIQIELLLDYYIMKNIIDSIQDINKNIAIPFYRKILSNICYTDFIDRVTFQKQICNSMKCLH